MNDKNKTRISCTNPDLIGTGSDFVTDNKDQLIKYEENNVEFEHLGWEFHHQLMDYSMLHPEETFHMNVDEALNFFSSVDYTLELKDGDYERVDAKPNYYVMEQVDGSIDFVKRSIFTDKLLSFLEAFPPHKLLPQNNLTDDGLSPQCNYDGLEVFLTFKYDDLDFSVRATNESGYFISAKFHLKTDEEKKEDQVKIEESNQEFTELIKKQIDSIYYERPF
jgi:hypothetical protein